jgi:hypothetical protein
MPESAEPYPLKKVLEAVEQEYDDEPLRAEDLLDAFELPINDTRRLRATLYELYLRGELLRASDVDEDGARDAYHLAEAYSG